MEDILELDVGENEFTSEELQPSEAKRTFGGKKREQIPQNLGAGEIQFPLNPDDYLTLDEAKRELLETLKEFHGENEENSSIKAEEVQVVYRMPVKSRLGVKMPMKARLGLRDDDDEEESMDCDVAETEDGNMLKENDNKSDLKTNTDRKHYNKIYQKDTTRNEDIPCRPTMTKLFKRLRVKWHHSPEMIGKEIAERLEEPKYHLIINVVKTIGGEKSLELFAETKQIQQDGGMHTSNGNRRRTSGGVFLTLLKEKFATEEEVKNIFREDSKGNTEKLKRRKALQRQRRRERNRQNKVAEEKMTVGQELEDCTEKLSESNDIGKVDNNRTGDCSC